MIVVTGATGKLGRQIVLELLKLTGPQQIAASVRNPSKAADLAARGVRLRRGDFEDSASLANAFEGATQLLLISSNASASGQDPIAQHRNAIEAARTAGVQRIVYTSHMGASASSVFPLMHDHATTEALLAESGIAWTALRNGFYASTVPMLIGDAASSGAIEAPQDGPVAWTTHADLAATAARILIDGGSFNGPTPPLTGGEASDLDAVAAILSEQTGRTIERRTIADEEQGRRLAQYGLPPAVVDITLAIYRAARAGEFAATDPTLARLIGRVPVSLRDVLARSSDG
ncbi:putative Quinone oxidoreductase 2 [Sphingomonas sp. T1]|uniref:SDR family oxidoreductase n=1 Tax=Sphingomonas sp. T1 TaxID=2653172 RepID=UPI0012F14814|nr:SDR family oxidoreductase [Sphingomonas sp. T1]VXD07423.1 putative Quinone oxidoreductase 2 [Sphingomonas sp. T1]